MATNCERCGHRDNEVKSGGGMEEKGRKITLLIENRDDMSRDVLKVSGVSALCDFGSKVIGTWRVVCRS